MREKNQNKSNNNMDSDEREKKVTDVIDFPNNIFCFITSSLGFWRNNPTEELCDWKLASVDCLG